RPDLVSRKLVNIFALQFTHFFIECLFGRASRPCASIDPASSFQPALLQFLTRQNALPAKADFGPAGCHAHPSGARCQMKDTLGVLLAGGAGERLYPLTRDRATAAVTFCGCSRIIDVTRSQSII